MPQRREHYDALVIGAGQGGIPLAEAFADAGWKTALVERAYVGGSCINYGCTPTKTMMGSADAAHWARRAADYGVHIDPPNVDLGVVRERKRKIVNSFRTKNREHLESLDGLDLIGGDAAFAGERTVDVRLKNGVNVPLEADTIIIDTGSRPAIPPISGIDRVPTLDSTSILEVADIPNHLAILGAGYVGVEFAQMFRRFGGTVSLIEQADHILPQEDANIAGTLQEILCSEGVTVRTGFTATYLEDADGHIRILGAEGERGLVVVCTDVLVALGRAPNTERLNLIVAGIETTDRGHIVVDEHLQTSVPDIYAIGDVNGGDPFTHISYDDYRILRTNLIDGGSASTENRILSYVVYTDPQLGRVGLSEDQARERGVDYRLAAIPMSHVARALETDRAQGMLKALVDPKTDRILGAEILGPEGGEIMSMLHIAMLADLPFTRLRDAPFAHPTYAEALNSLFASWSDS